MRILNARDEGYSPDKRVWLNGKEITDQAWRAWVPNRPGVTGLGWADIYEVDAEGNIIFVEEVNGPRSYRGYGFVWWKQQAA